MPLYPQGLRIVLEYGVLRSVHVRVVSIKPLPLDLYFQIVEALHVSTICTTSYYTSITYLVTSVLSSSYLARYSNRLTDKATSFTTSALDIMLFQGSFVASSALDVMLFQGSFVALFSSDISLSIVVKRRIKQHNYIIDARSYAFLH